MKALDITGNRYGRLVALRMVGRRNGFILWECQCDCGKLHTVTTGSLRDKKVRSCGCLEKPLRKYPAACQGVSRQLVAVRIRGLGWDITKAVNTPTRKYTRYTILPNHPGIPIELVRNRVFRGWPVERACTEPVRRKGGK